MADFVLAARDRAVVLVLPPPDPDIGRDPELVGGTHTTLGGSTVQHVLAVKRVYTLTWTYLSDADFRAIEAFHQRRHGPGAFLFTWPGQPDVPVHIVSLTDSSPHAADADGLDPWHTATLTLREV